MIIGVVAATTSAASSGSPYPDALAVMDFMTLDYWLGQTEVTVADAIDQPSYVGAAGLQIVDTQPNPTQILGTFRALLITMNWTIVLEWLDVYAADTTWPLWIKDTSTASYENTFIESNSTTVDFYDEPVPGTDKLITKSGLTAAPTIRRAAITRTNSNFAVSINGGSVTADTASGTVTAYDSASFGGRPDESYIRLDVNIRRLIIYEPQSDAALPGLSTV